jgi:uncharacterized protein YqgC (DUF456 family)
MKKLLVLLAVIVMLVSIAADLPPAMPSSFYGDVIGWHAGQTVTVFIGAAKVATAKVFKFENRMVYTVKVPMDNVAEGTLAIFRIGGRVCAKAPLHSGTNVMMNLRKR